MGVPGMRDVDPLPVDELRVLLEWIMYCILHCGPDIVFFSMVCFLHCPLSLSMRIHTLSISFTFQYTLHTYYFMVHQTLSFAVEHTLFMLTLLQ